MPTQLAPPSVHRSDSQRSDNSRRVTFRRGVEVQRVPSGRTAPVLRRQPPPDSAEEVARQAEDIIRQLDSVTCDVRTTERPINNGLRPPGQQQGDKFGSLSRASLRKKGKSGARAGSRTGSVKSVSTNTLPAQPPRSSSLEADKNNILKAESLRRKREGELSRLQVNGFLKRSSSQVDHLNNLNSLKDDDDRYNNYPDKIRLSSEDRELNKNGDKGKRLNDKLSSKPSHRSTPTLPTIRVTPEYEAPKKKSHSTSQTSPRRLDASTMPRQAPPPRPDRIPGQYRPLHGFSYIGREDAERIGYADSVESRSRHIIDQIARSRSRSPDVKPTRTRPRSRSSSPDPVPGMRAYSFESPRERYGYDPLEESRSYDFDPPRLTRKYDYDPPKLDHSYDYDPPEEQQPYACDPPPMTRTYREESPLISSSYDTFDSPAIRVTRPDAPPVTHTFRYEYDSSGEPRTYRDDVPVARTRTYHFQSEPTESSRVHREQVETARSYRFQEDALDSSFEPPDSRRDRYGSSIVMIGEQPPEIISTASRRPAQSTERSTERSPRLSTVKEGSFPSDQEQHYRAPRGGDLYSMPRQGAPREAENVIRLSVSGSHSSGGQDVIDSRRADRQQSAGFDTSPERPRVSPSDATERRRIDEKTRRVDVRRTDTMHHVSSSSESPRRRDSRDPSEERRPPRTVNGHRRESRESRGNRGHGTLERARRRVERDRHHDGKHRHDRKKNFEIKFMYDDKDEPSDVRLAKFTEYRGSDEGASPSPPAGRRRRNESDEPDELDGDGGPRRHEKSDGKSTFLTRVENSRVQTSERRDGRNNSPGHHSGDRDPHGEWSSRTDEDRVDGGYRRSERVKVTRHSDGVLREDREKTQSSVSSDENKRHRSRGRSSSQERRSREKSIEKSSDKSTEKSKKKGWLSATLSRLDLRKSSDDKRRSSSPRRRGSHSPEQRRGSHSPEQRRGSHSPEQRRGSFSPDLSGAISERREKRSSASHGTASRRRDGRSGSRDSYGTSDDRGHLSSDRERQPRDHRGSAGRSERRSSSREPRSSHETRRHPPAEKRDSNRSSDLESRQYLSSDTQERRGGRGTVDRRTGRKEPRSGGRPASRTASFSRRYPDDEPESVRGGAGRRPVVRRPSGADTSPRRGRRSSHSVTSSVNSSGSEPAAPTGSRASAAGDRSVYLHATTVADIPSPDGQEAPHEDSGPLPTVERRKVSRSFSMLTPFKLKHPNDKTINYDNEKVGKDARANGRPPRAPRPRRDSRDEVDERSAERSPERRRHRVSRSSSLPKGSRSAYRSEDRPAR